MLHISRSPEEREAADEDDSDLVYSCNDEEVDITDLKIAIMALQASEFSDEPPEGKEEINFTVYLDNEYYPKITVGLYRYDGTYCVASINGEPFSPVKRSLVVALIEAVNAIVL